METLDSFDAVLRQFAEKLERRTISIELVNQETHFCDAHWTEIVHHPDGR
jgi:hypothetical protein